MKTIYLIVFLHGKYWNQNGKLHREDGPAVEWVDGSKEWYINGKFIKSEP